MKKLKYRSRLILGFLVVAFALASCQKEDINLEHSNHAKVEPALKIVKLTNKDITQNKGVTNKLNFFIETLKTRQQNKTVYSSEYDFYINTDFATYIEKANGSHSYTFPVQYANETGEINNLVLHSQDDGNYKAFYVSYDVTEDEKALISNGEPVDLEGKVSIGLVNDTVFIDSLFSKATTLDQCLIPMYSVGECDAGYSYIHNPEPFSTGGGMCSGSTYTLVNVSTDMDCLNSGEEGSPGSGDDTSSSNTGNPNGGGLNSSENEPITIPLTCEGCPEIEDEDCPIDEEAKAELESVFGLGNFTTDCNISADDVPAELHFETVEELQEFWNEYQQSKQNYNFESSILTNDNPFGQDEVIVTAKFFTFPFSNYVFDIKQVMGDDHQYFTDYDVTEVAVSLSGITVFDEINITTFAHSMDSYVSQVDIKCDAHAVLFFKGVGRIASDNYLFRITMNATDGSFMSQSWVY